MDLGFTTKRWFGLSPRKRKWLAVLAVVGVSGYGAYKVYYLPAVVRQRARVVKLVDSLISAAELISDSAETMNEIARDLKEFLRSDSDEIPRSMRQVFKLVKSPEFSESLAGVSQALAGGMLRGYYSEYKSCNGRETEANASSSFVDKVLDRMTSDSGAGFVSVVVGSFAKNLVLGFFDSGKVCVDGAGSSGGPEWVAIVGDDKCKGLIISCVEKFVSTAVTVFLDKTMHINTYDDFFAGLTNPKHQNSVRDVLVSVCNNAVETLVRTSHQILSHSRSESSSVPKFAVVEHDGELHGQTLKIKKPGHDTQNGGWVNQVSSTLAVPSNRKFVLDVTGRVTFETVRSVVEYVLFKMSDGVKENLQVVHEEVADKGKKVIRYVGAKSYVILTICLALYLHIFGETTRFA